MTAGNSTGMKFAIAQVHCIDSDLEGNLRRMESLAEEARRAGASAVFFPEAVDLGWVNPEAWSLAGPVPGSVSQAISEIAGRKGLWIGTGLIERDGEDLFDSAVLVSPEGRIVLKHRKINLLSELMDPPYRPGNGGDIRVVDTPLGRIGILICADCFDSRLVGRMAELRPELLYVPFGWAHPVQGWPEHGFQLIKTVQSVARRCRAFVIGPNLVGKISSGPWKGRTYEGLSLAADPDGVLLVQGKWNQVELILVDTEACR